MLEMYIHLAVAYGYLLIYFNYLEKNSIYLQILDYIILQHK